MIKMFANSGGAITYTAEELCASLNTFANNINYIMAGIGEELNVTHATNSLKVTLKTGKAIICGRPVDVQTNEEFTLSASQQNVYLVLRADISRPSGQECFLTYVTESQLKSENINGSGTMSDLKLAKLTTSSTGVSSYTDLRVIKAKAGGFEYEVVKNL